MVHWYLTNASAVSGAAWTWPQTHQPVGKVGYLATVFFLSSGSWQGVVIYRWEEVGYLPLRILLASLFGAVGMKVVKGAPVGCGPETCGGNDISGDTATCAASCAGVTGNFDARKF